MADASAATLALPAKALSSAMTAIPSSMPPDNLDQHHESPPGGVDNLVIRNPIPEGKPGILIASPAKSAQSIAKSRKS